VYLTQAVSHILMFLSQTVSHVLNLFEINPSLPAFTHEFRTHKNVVCVPPQVPLSINDVPSGREGILHAPEGSEACQRQVS
jgi:hypothetical protein